MNPKSKIYFHCKYKSYTSLKDNVYFSMWDGVRFYLADAFTQSDLQLMTTEAIEVLVVLS